METDEVRFQHASSQNGTPKSEKEAPRLFLDARRATLVGEDELRTLMKTRTPSRAMLQLCCIVYKVHTLYCTQIPTAIKE